MKKHLSPSLVIYGPQACGKTRNAEALMRHYGLDRVLDDWDGTSPVPPGTLALTHQHPPYYADVTRILSFDQTPAAAR